VRVDRTEAHIACFIFTNDQRQGFAREGCQALVRHLFTGYGVARIIAEMDTHNQASVRLTQSLGFEQVALTPGADHFKGRTSDEFRYELNNHA